ncbi:MAG: protein kinase [Myxococcales bacterium]|nr:protein kinase [Myxococcales bacterium]
MLTAGELVDRKYRLLKRLGSGALGEVWAARNETVEREVAIKFLVPAWSIAPRSLDAFFREAKSSGKIRHPSVVQFLDIGEIEDERKIPFVVMELLECEKLESLLAREKHLPVGTALRMISELAWALVAGHDRSLIHERIEPANVLLHRDLKGEIVPKLVDFGIARLVDDLGPLSVTGSAHEALSPLAYLSPEQIHGDVELDGRADVYALGVLLHRVLVGRVPFEASDPEVLLEQVEQGSPYLEAFEPPLDAKVMNLVSDCLQRNRRLRPTMRVLAERADALLERIDPQWKRFGTLVSIPEDRTARKLEAMRPSSRPPRSNELPTGKKQSAPRIPAAPIVPHVAVPAAIPKPSIGAPIGGRVTSAKPAGAKATLMGVAPNREGHAPTNPRIDTLPMKPIPDPRIPIGAPLRAPSLGGDPAKISRATVKVTPAQAPLGARSGPKGTVDPPTLKIENNPFAARPAAAVDHGHHHPPPVPHAAVDHGHHHPPPVPHRIMTPPLPRGAPKAAAQSVPPPPHAQRTAPSHGLASAPLVDDDEAPVSSGALEEIPPSSAPDSAIPISGHDVEEVDEDMAATQQRKPPLPRAAPPPSMDETGDELATISHLIAERLSGSGQAPDASGGLQLDVLHDLESELLKRVAVSRASLPDVTEAAVLEGRKGRGRAADGGPVRVQFERTARAAARRRRHVRLQEARGEGEGQAPGIEGALRQAEARGAAPQREADHRGGRDHTAHRPTAAQQRPRHRVRAGGGRDRHRARAAHEAGADHRLACFLGERDHRGHAGAHARADPQLHAEGRRGPDHRRVVGAERQRSRGHDRDHRRSRDDGGAAHDHAHPRGDHATPPGHHHGRAHRRGQAAGSRTLGHGPEAQAEGQRRPILRRRERRFLSARS